MGFQRKDKADAVQYGVKVRLYPTVSQTKLLDLHFAATRSVWNHYLGKRKDLYEAAKATTRYSEQQADLTREKQTSEHKWWSQASNPALQMTLQHLDDAYVRFFKGLARYPRFKAKGTGDSYTIPNCINGKDWRIRVVGGKVILPKFKEGIRFRSGRLPQSIRSITISKKHGSYYASFCCERAPQSSYPAGSSIGIDVGIKTLGVCSDGQVFDKYEVSKKKARKLKRYQRQMSRRVHGKGKKPSNGYKVAQQKHAKLQAKIANGRKDRIHKMTSDIVKNNDVICLEDLNTQGMLKNHSLARHVANASFYEIRRQIEYKSAWHHRVVSFVNRWYPSSKTCHNCGWIKKDLTLSVRHWVCPKCSASHDRDANAALNIRDEGLRLLRHTPGDGGIHGRGLLEPNAEMQEVMGRAKRQLYARGDSCI